MTDKQTTSTLLEREADLANQKAAQIKELLSERAGCETRIKTIGTELKSLGHKRTRAKNTKAFEAKAHA